MPKMPDKVEFWAMVLAWLSQHMPVLYAAGLSFVMAVVRIIYGGGSRRQALLEGALCGGLTLGLISGLEFFGLPQSLSTFVGGWVGFLGVKKVSDIADRFTDWRVPRRPDQQ